MANKSLTWKGGALVKKMREAQIAGVNKTMGDSVQHAYENHPWKNRTAALEGSLDVHEPAHEVAHGVEGKWGSADINYALPMELGATIQHPGGTAYYIDEDGKAVFVSNASALSEGLPRTKPHTIVIPPHPFLRPAADARYPDLPGNIRKAFEKRGTKDGDGNG